MSENDKQRQNIAYGVYKVAQEIRDRIVIGDGIACKDGSCTYGRDRHCPHKAADVMAHALEPFEIEVYESFNGWLFAHSCNNGGKSLAAMGTYWFVATIAVSGHVTELCNGALDSESQSTRDEIFKLTSDLERMRVIPPHDVKVVGREPYEFTIRRVQGEDETVSRVKADSLPLDMTVLSAVLSITNSASPSTSWANGAPGELVGTWWTRLDRVPVTYSVTNGDIPDDAWRRILSNFL